ncbi:MAG: SO_0444 family Cu/Zn efflux transporter [Opitutae bacterium]|nr:SO_0444 family Cu/Zn efflux transporter [Opitutae bacterium]
MISGIEILTNFFDFLWMSFLLLSPMLLLGLFLSGLIHVFISRQAVLRWLRDDSLKSVSASAAVGVPIPLCSCSVVPVVAEMRRKGASRSSCMSFLITAPETGADSILVTNAFFGPIVAIIRPVISFLTAVVAGIFSSGLIRSEHHHDHDHDHDHDHGHDHDHEHGHDHDHHHGHDHGTHQPLISESNDCYVSPSQLKVLLVDWLKRISTAASGWKFGTWVKPEFYRRPEVSEEPTDGDTHPVGLTTDGQRLDFKKLAKHIFRYGFVEIADDILFALLVGIILGGFLYLAIPNDLMSNEYARWLSYPVMVLIGIPLYICASASTPIAAALVAKGFSPGAALIFLMTGPATNTGTIAIIISQFGVRFASVYVGSVIAVTVLLGILVDMLILAFGLSISVNLSASHAPAILFLQWGGAILMIALIIWRFRAGAMRSGYEDLLSNFRPLSRRWRNVWGRLTRNRSFRGVISPTTPMGIMFWALAFALFIGSGFTIVPPGHLGYGRLLGKVYWRDLQPGLHYLAPNPLLQVDKWPVREVKSIMSDTPQEFVAGDLNLLSLTLNVQYRVKDPYVYHYRTSNAPEVITGIVRDHLRSFVSSRDLEKLLNVYRVTVEQHVSELFKSDGEGKGTVLDAVDLVRISLLEINPVAEAVSAFRDVSSAQEDQERIIVNAQKYLVSLAPQAHGNAEWEIKQAQGEAFRKVTTAEAEAEAISKVSAAVRNAPSVLRNMLWREKLETALSGNTKIIVPSRESLDKVALWKRNSNGAGAEPRHHERGKE